MNNVLENDVWVKKVLVSSLSLHMLYLTTREVVRLSRHLCIYIYVYTYVYFVLIYKELRLTCGGTPQSQILIKNSGSTLG